MSAPPTQPFLDLWGLELVGRPVSDREPYPGTGDVAFVRRGGRQLVLKTLPAGSDEMRSGEVLAHWDGRGAVRVVEQAPGAVLIERAAPGDDLCAMVLRGEDDAATDILCDVMAELNHPAPSSGAPFRTVADWGRGFARNRAAALALGVPPKLIDRGEAVFFELCASQAAPILLHGDLQHFNIVRDAARGWLAIDPKGIVGEPAYETGALLRNPNVDASLCADRAIIERRARQICARLGYDYQRVVGWCFSQWVLSVLWAVEDHLPYAPDWLRGPLAAEALIG